MATVFVGHPHAAQRVGDILEANLADARWTAFDAAVAFVKSSGVRHVAEGLTAFCQRGTVRILVGVDFGGTSVEGLSALREAMAGRGELWICHNAVGSTFHPKVFVFRNDTQAFAVIGSTNFTEGGLYTNSEAALAIELNLNEPVDASIVAEIDDALRRWSDPAAGTARLLDDALFDSLAQQGYLPPELYSPESEEAAHVPTEEAEEQDAELFAAAPVPRAPRRVRAVVAPARTAEPTIFMMTLQRTDVGAGQVTPGTSRRSPEIFVPLSARDACPSFWDWPGAFVEDPTHAGKFDRAGVLMLIGTRIETVNMMTWPAKHDFRLRCEALRSAGRIGDIMKIERVQGETFDYRVIIIPMSSRDYAAARALCVNKVRNSQKEYCYL